MKRKLALVLTVSVVAILTACQSVLSQSGKDSADNIPQEDVGEMGTDEEPHTFKYVIDHAIQDGKIQPLIIVLPTYNNTSGNDSGDYGLALKLTDQFHNELVNDLIPAVEGRYSTYAEDTPPQVLRLPVTIGDLADFPWVPSIHGVHFGTALIISGILCP